MKPLQTLGIQSEKKCVGRPKSDNPRSAKVVISVTPSEYERTVKAAGKYALSLSDLGREALKRFLRPTASEYAQENKQPTKPAPPSGADGWKKEL